MPVEILLEAKGFALLPATDEDADKIRSFAIGSLVRASIVRSKSQQALRWYWKLIELVAEATGVGKRPLSNELLIRNGYVESITFRNGERHHIPRSIANMKHAEFTEYVNAAVEMLCREYVYKARGKLLGEVGNMLGITFDEAFAK